MKNYKAIGKIGEGTFSEVMKMQSLRDGNYYACKQMKQHFERLFEKKKLDPGRRHPLSEKKIMHYMYQLCKSLDHMHRQDVLKLGDFGSCRSVYSKQPYTEYISTRWYRAPECLLTDGFYTYKMDLWSAGCVFYEIASLQPLFPGVNELDQISKIHDVIGTPCQKTLTKFKQAAETQTLAKHRRAFCPKYSMVPESSSHNWSFSKEGRKQQSLRQEEGPARRQGPASLMELPKLRLSGMTKLSSCSSPALRSKTDTQKDIKPHLKHCHLPTINRKGGEY
ncbi:MAPK/MAK/MRK overlapping kinase [Apodemus speciosus]|uniref:MAPK/MAK/MRK overlapping kinase n=1 Tax=Apodemus speciosus TaxID=105296 RepID=A0ABQ0FEV3_APOSI